MSDDERATFVARVNALEQLAAQSTEYEPIKTAVAELDELAKPFVEHHDQRHCHRRRRAPVEDFDHCSNSDS